MKGVIIDKRFFLFAGIFSFLLILSSGVFAANVYTFSGSSLLTGHLTDYPRCSFDNNPSTVQGGTSIVPTEPVGTICYDWYATTSGELRSSGFIVAVSTASVAPIVTPTFTTTPVADVRFGGATEGSGEGITSKRTSGGNRYGIDFITNFLTRMIITNGGNVGIGTSNPKHNLEINGIDNSLVLLSTATTGNRNTGFELRTTVADGVSYIDFTNGSTDTAGSGTPDFSGRIAWNEAGTGAFAIHGGNVGIGTTTPASLLHIKGPSSNLMVESSDLAGARLTLNDSASSTGSFLGSWQMINRNANGNLAFFRVGTTLETLTLTPTGNVGIGKTPAYKLDVAGAVAATDFIYTSDIKLKENINPLEGSLNKILELQGVSFNWKDNGEGNIGLIAQDVEKVYPELVSTSADGIKSVKYGNLVAPLIESVKEQNKRIDEQQKQIDELKKEIERLKNDERWF